MYEETEESEINMECKFCKMYEDERSLAKERKLEHGVNTYLKIRLYSSCVKNRATVSACSFRPMKFRYCPVCGKKLKGMR